MRRRSPRRSCVELCGARLAPGTVDVCEPLPTPLRIPLRPAHVTRVLGIEIARGREVEILRALDFEVSDADSERLSVTVPPFRRGDVTREADLVEEIARIAGLEQLPVTLPARRGAYGVLSAEQRMRRRAVDALVGCGLCEVMGLDLRRTRGAR